MSFKKISSLLTLVELQATKARWLRHPAEFTGIPANILCFSPNNWNQYNRHYLVNLLSAMEPANIAYFANKTENKEVQIDNLQITRISRTPNTELWTNEQDTDNTLANNMRRLLSRSASIAWTCQPYEFRLIWTNLESHNHLSILQRKYTKKV